MTNQPTTPVNLTNPAGKPAQKKNRNVTFRIVGALLLLAGILFIIISIAGFAVGKYATRTQGTIVVESCSRSIGRGSTTSYECRGTFTPNDTSMPSKFFASNAGGGIRTGMNLTPGVTYTGYAVGGFDDATLTDSSQVVIDGDTQSQQSTYALSIIFALLGIGFTWGGIAFWRIPSNRAKSKA